ncbi:MAG: HAD family phosphatase [Candidatus Thermoplasmatota archaeon]
MTKIVVFDLDGVLVNIDSSWEFVHEHFGVNNNESLQAYLKSEINDEEFMKRDIMLWLKNGNLHISKIEGILKDVPIMAGAKETIHELKQYGIKTAIISGGLDILAERVKRALGIDYSIANSLATDSKGFLLGYGILNVALTDKATPLKRLLASTGIKAEDCVAVGNSRFDISMFEVAGFNIAFNACDELVKRYADVIVNSENLIRILPYIIPSVQKAACQIK